MTEHDKLVREVARAICLSEKDPDWVCVPTCLLSQDCAHLANAEAAVSLCMQRAASHCDDQATDYIRGSDCWMALRITAGQFRLMAHPNHPISSADQMPAAMPSAAPSAVGQESGK